MSGPGNPHQAYVESDRSSSLRARTRSNLSNANSNISARRPSADDAASSSETRGSLPRQPSVSPVQAPSVHGHEDPDSHQLRTSVRRRCILLQKPGRAANHILHQSSSETTYDSGESSHRSRSDVSDTPSLEWNYDDENAVELAGLPDLELPAGPHEPWEYVTRDARYLFNGNPENLAIAVLKRSIQPAESSRRDVHTWRGRPAVLINIDQALYQELEMQQRTQSVESEGDRSTRSRANSYVGRRIRSVDID